MKRIGYTSLALLSVFTLAMAAGVANATPVPITGVVTERIFNDCPLSTVTTVNNYPSSISITDAWSDLCVGFANRHNWRFSTDGSSSAVFGNNNDFKYSAVMEIVGSGTCEAGLEVAPWWSPDAGGRIQARIPDGEIACFDGRLPFYSFSNPAGHNLRYTGGKITMEIEYHENGLSSGSPATIEYRVVYNNVSYTSGPLPFDQANPAEDPPHGQWGMLDPAYVGGMAQTNNGTAGTGRTYVVNWEDISFTCFDCATSAQKSTWGRLKSLYR
ncbi:MAG: hypothetical protein HOP12_04655 [Candidatus Eisenbacteria bacterium]|uniref:Uncharacterized protein n=1 Tax=Eiseniibacteriota bacterium TaxID=2212470 RepID=A0A849SLI1_UNCEI|nr:hypothetical protein [Candidatus Eisenbacteria bacterium]